ncbi:unnamed protein product [Cunninghamella echinulata]
MIFKEIKGCTIYENENGDFDFVADSNANKVTSIIEKVIEDNESQGFSNALILVKEITDDDFDKLFQILQADACTDNTFLNDIHNTNETVVINNKNQKFAWNFQ